MRWLVYVLLAALVVQALRHGLEAQILEERIAALEKVECPKPPPPQVIQIEKTCPKCEPCEICEDCERCPSYWELCE